MMQGIKRSKHRIGRSYHQREVEDFMFNAQQELPQVPAEPPEEVRILRAKLILEEALETIEALGVRVDILFPEGNAGLQLCNDHPDAEFRFMREDQPGRPKFNMVKAVDGCCDLRVVTTGTLSALGVADTPVQRMIDESNLKKFGPGGHRRDDGKWIKPPDWKAPDLATELRRQGWRPSNANAHVDQPPRQPGEAQV